VFCCCCICLFHYISHCGRPRWVTIDELENFDLVTYGYGDQSRVYIRGQFTFHRNTEKINNLFRKCEYLSKIDERFKAGVKKTQFESAEGCYSSVILETHDLRVKYAVKAFTDHFDASVHGYHNTAESHGVIVGIGRKGDKSVVYKTGQFANERESLPNLSTTWFEDANVNGNKDHIYANTSQPLQWEVGEMTKIYTIGEKSYNHVPCTSMYWVRKKYQSHLCVKGAEKMHTLFLINGVLFKQKFEVITSHENIETMAFFHLQEWKRVFTRSSQLLPLRHDGNNDFRMEKLDRILGWMFIPEGVIPLLPLSDPANGIDLLTQFPQRINNIEDKNGFPKKMLSHSSFCLLAHKKSRPLTTECRYELSWQDEDITILNNDELWQEVDLLTDVTLALTIQVTAEQVQLKYPVHRLFDVIEANLENWGSHPVVLLVYIGGAKEWVGNELQKRFGTNSIGNAFRLTGFILSERTNVVSRNALLNMAEVACHTRWIISGLEIERGMMLSTEAYFFAKRAINVHGKVTGNIHVIPQFATDKNWKIDNTRISILDLISLAGSNDVSISSNLANFDCPQCREKIDDKHENIENQIDQVWWDLTKSEILQSDDEFQIMNGHSTSAFADVVKSLQLELTNMLTEMNFEKVYHFDKSPILMLDKLGPRDGMLTSSLALEVDEFGGLQCMNALRLAQLSTLGYRILPTTGAFAISYPETRSASCLEIMNGKRQSNSRCDGCLMLSDERLIKKIAREESARIAKIAMLLEELST